MRGIGGVRGSGKGSGVVRGVVYGGVRGMARRNGGVVFFAKKGLEPELHGGQLISSPVASIVSLVSPKKVTDPTLWGKLFFGHALFHFQSKMHPVAIMPKMASWGTKRSVLSHGLQRKKFDQIGHAVLELSSIEKLLTGVFGCRAAQSRPLFQNNFSENFWVD